MTPVILPLNSYRICHSLFSHSKTYFDNAMAGGNPYVGCLSNYPTIVVLASLCLLSISLPSPSLQSSHNVACSGSIIRCVVTVLLKPASSATAGDINY